MNSRVIGATALACFAFAAATAGAQARFEAVSQGAVEGAPGLRVITLRDRARNSCYLLFVSERADARTPGAGLDLDQARVLRDQRLAGLVHAYEQDRGAIPGTIIPNPLKYEFQGGATQIDFALVVIEELFARLEDELERLTSASRNTMTAMPTPC